MLIRHVLASALALTFSGVALAAPPVAPSPEWSARLFIDIFNRVCVKNIGRSDLLVKEMKLRKAEEMTPALAKPYLRGPEGRAWMMNNVVGEFVIALRPDNVCSVHAKRLRTDFVESGFSELAGVPPRDTTVKKLRDQRAGDQPFHMLTYVWALDGATQQTIFTLSTTMDPDAPLHAIASVALLE